MLHKTFDLIETKTDGDAGSFTALASVFGNVDRVGDRMMKGSFSKTLEKWRESGKPLPVILSHSWDDPHKYVGEADPRAVMETDEGLLVQGKMYMDEDLGKKVYELMKRGILTGWSFGYQVPKGGQQKTKDGVNEVSEVELFEVGPTLVGANAEAQLQEIKSVLGVEEEVEKAPEPTISVEMHDKEMKALRNELEGDLAELREAVEVLQTSHEVERNEEPSQAKSPDPLREESRKAVHEVMLDGIRRFDVEPSPPEPEPEIDVRELRRQSREVMASILKE